LQRKQCDKSAKLVEFGVLISLPNVTALGALLCMHYDERTPFFLVCEAYAPSQKRSLPFPL
jgi:hypothetical protein